MTYSVFVVEALNNGPPKASLKFEGPVAGNEDVLAKIDGDSSSVANDSKSKVGQELYTGVQRIWPKVKDIDQQVRYDKRVGIINRSHTVDWSHAGEHEDAMAARAEIEAEKKDAYRNYGRGAPRNEEQEKKMEKYKTVIAENVDPFEETNVIRAPGWYRLCVSAEGHPLMVEMEIRSSSKLGGIDPETRHVFTYEVREMLDEEKSLDEDTKATGDFNTYASVDEELQKEIENQVKEQDLHATKAQLKKLDSMVMEMKKKHLAFQHRIKNHKATAQRNHASLIRSGKIETLLYLVITGMQVWTVHKWLLSTNLLGR